ncbi:MAG: ABC transporter permease [Puia sp.]|nr:ABC transporter permease [Puia sp.]
MNGDPEKIEPELNGGNTVKDKIGRFFITLYDLHRFMLRFFREAFLPPYEFRETIRQSFDVGLKSLSIITLTGFIVGVVFTKQSRTSLLEFGATSWLPSLIAIALMRALAPLVTALIVAGKVGSHIGAELGSMKVTEQIDAMEVSSTNPFKFLVVTRIEATTLMVPILVIYMAFISLLGAYLDVHLNEATSFPAFFQQAFMKINLYDIVSIMIKSAVYGFTVGMAGCYIGYNAQQGTVGVGKSANKSVVVSMFLIFIEEMLLIQVLNYGKQFF